MNRKFAAFYIIFIIVLMLLSKGVQVNMFFPLICIIADAQICKTGSVLREEEQKKRRLLFFWLFFFCVLSGCRSVIITFLQSRRTDDCFDCEAARCSVGEVKPAVHLWYG